MVYYFKVSTKYNKEISLKNVSKMLSFNGRLVVDYFASKCVVFSFVYFTLDHLYRVKELFIMPLIRGNCLRETRQLVRLSIKECFLAFEFVGVV